ncbi:hypothetical protein LOK49_LG02G01277 [Camellia lanceoleosa]|uniref:Uncharacterized protein n=1 Tax=Camellia lanceoleosa TaxID=1840588 RepID=A0ACC0IPH9_9ERIC|nr:hypothetical protein LOK49_LG02G01277 [Camellia lanceoleosa]
MTTTPLTTTTLCVYQREANVDHQTETWVSRCGSAEVDRHGAPPTSTTTTPPRNEGFKQTIRIHLSRMRIEGFKRGNRRSSCKRKFLSMSKENTEECIAYTVHIPATPDRRVSHVDSQTSPLKTKKNRGT